MTMNFPLCSNEWNLSKEDMLQYLSLFPGHSFFGRPTDQFYLTNHKFNDGLRITCRWQKKEKCRVIRKLSDIFEALEHNEMLYHGYNIVSFSFDNQSNPAAEKLFFEAFGHKKIALSPRQYELLEFAVDESNLIYTDNWYQSLMTHSYNILAFERYCAEQSNKQES